MSKSLERVRAALLGAGLEDGIVEVGQARTAAEAAAAVGCEIDQIAKSMLFAHEGAPDRLTLLLTAGGNQVHAERAARTVGHGLVRADADTVRRVTGFAVGGVAPIGHLSPVEAFLDPRLADFPVVWAAAGTPRHVFPIAPDTLLRLTGARLADFTG